MSRKNHSLSSPLSLRQSDHYVRWMSVCTITMHIKARRCISVRLPAAQTSMKIFPDPPPVKHKPALPPTNPARPL